MAKTRENKPRFTMFIKPLSFSLYAINNQMNSVLSILQLIVYEGHSLSTDLNKKFVQRSVNRI